jgi:hypothetical protein
MVNAIALIKIDEGFLHCWMAEAISQKMANAATKQEKV